MNHLDITYYFEDSLLSEDGHLVRGHIPYLLHVKDTALAAVLLIATANQIVVQTVFTNHYIF